MRARTLAVTLVLTWLQATSCDHAAPTPAEAEPEAASPASDDPALAEAGSPPSPTPADPVPAPEPEPEPEPAPVPLEIRKTRHAMMIYPQPALSAGFRGKLPHGEAFAVWEHVPGPECRGPWGRVATAGFVCLDDTEPTEEVPATLPRLPAARLVPFHYAKNRDKENPAPVWRSHRAMAAGAEPIDALAPEHVYAFTWRRRGRNGGYLADERRRTVASKDVKHLDPSEFAGRDLQTAPVPDDQVLGWTVQWPHTTVYATPGLEAPTVAKLDYHTEIYLRDEPVQADGITFFPLADGRGFVSAKESRRWLPLLEPLPQVAADETWIDVELDQQTLTVLRGTEPVYVTLVSSGTWKDPTPTGVFRIEGKMALSDMRSREGDDEAYHVEDVPWVMYFKGRYALHGAYWHDRFGRRTSHGCINLSAVDARKVYTLTAPHAPPGWLMVFEHEHAPGTVLRVRSRDRVPEDKRTPLGASAGL